jgi:ABC-type Fe3+-hydroxamate transport system substrate-binding protein
MRDKRKKFIDLAEARVNRAIKDIRLIGNLANKASYEYDDDDAKEIFRALQKELDAAKSRFTGNGKTGEDSFRLSRK